MIGIKTQNSFFCSAEYLATSHKLTTSVKSNICNLVAFHPSVLVADRHWRKTRQNTSFDVEKNYKMRQIARADLFFYVPIHFALIHVTVRLMLLIVLSHTVPFMSLYLFHQKCLIFCSLTAVELHFSNSIHFSISQMIN